MINTILSSINALIVAALPLYSRVDSFYTPLDNIDSGDYPIAMIYDPQVSFGRLLNRQDDKTYRFLCALIRGSEQATQMRTDLELVETGFKDDPSLTSTVDDARLESWQSFEAQSARTTGGMIIEVRLVE